MTLKNLTKRLSTIKRSIVTSMLCLLAMTFVWQGAFFSNNVAMASNDVGDKVQNKVDKDAGRAKNFIQDTKEKVQDAAKSNASKVEDATDGKGNAIERKAKKDKARILEKSEKDAARTEKAVDNTQNAIERTVENIKDAFSK